MILKRYDTTVGSLIDCTWNGCFNATHVELALNLGGRVWCNLGPVRKRAYLWEYWLDIGLICWSEKVISIGGMLVLTSGLIFRIDIGVDLCEFV